MQLKGLLSSPQWCTIFLSIFFFFGWLVWGKNQEEGECLSPGCHNKMPWTGGFKRQMFISHILRGWACEVSVLAWSGSGMVKLWQGPSSWLVGSASSHKAERALVSLSLKGYQSYPPPPHLLISSQSNHLPKTLPPNTTTWGWGPHVWILGDTFSEEVKYIYLVHISSLKVSVSRNLNYSFDMGIA